MRRFLSSRIITIIALIGLGALVIPLTRIIPTVTENTASIDRLKEELETLKKEDQNFDEKKAYYQSNDYLEQQARIRLNYKKADEHVVFIYKNTPTPSPNTTPPIQSQRSLLQRFLDYFHGKNK